MSHTLDIRVYHRLASGAWHDGGAADEIDDDAELHDPYLLEGWMETHAEVFHTEERYGAEVSCRKVDAAVLESFKAALDGAAPPDPWGMRHPCTAGELAGAFPFVKEWPEPTLLKFGLSSSVKPTKWEGGAYTRYGFAMPPAKLEACGLRVADRGKLMGMLSEASRAADALLKILGENPGAMLVYENT